MVIQFHFKEKRKKRREKLLTFYFLISTYKYKTNFMMLNHTWATPRVGREVVEVQSLSMHHDARHTWATPLEGGGEGMEVS